MLMRLHSWTCGEYMGLAVVRLFYFVCKYSGRSLRKYNT